MRPQSAQHDETCPFYGKTVQRCSRSTRCKPLRMGGSAVMPEIHAFWELWKKAWPGNDLDHMTGGKSLQLSHL